jgi:alpha-tubulin suppressor-like RCC1 family protein
MSKLRLELTLRELVGVGALHPYHVLKERGDGVVAQAEHTVIVTEQGCEVITRSTTSLATGESNIAQKTKKCSKTIPINTFFRCLQYF